MAPNPAVTGTLFAPDPGPSLFLCFLPIFNTAISDISLPAIHFGNTMQTSEIWLPLQMGAAPVEITPESSWFASLESRTSSSLRPSSSIITSYYCCFLSLVKSSQLPIAKPQLNVQYSAPGCLQHPHTVDQLCEDQKHLIFCQGVTIAKISSEIVKFGALVNIIEAKNMIFMAQNAEFLRTKSLHTIRMDLLIGLRYLHLHGFYCR
ncbi:hypothetical protein N7508_010094 [Penicillium antarcticum]|uniref:uncharacterized protein n=1 Tax=Penicillium antarcticum TaxID=416450 RepID=UPI0023941F97|nr:uncharacterized protein N7508_010094 [Penicillium antarcticum]KAJ5295273.1 hypothetical protein N7508_010094 [Penicillium antarcticum]